MPNPKGVSPTWTLLLDLYPVIFPPETLANPANNDLSVGHSVETHTARAKADLKLAMKKQQSIQLPARASRLPRFKSLFSALKNLAGRLEAHIDQKIKDYARSAPQTSRFPRLTLLRELSLDTESPCSETPGISQHPDSRYNTHTAHVTTASTSTTDAPIADVTRFIQFPHDSSDLERLCGAIDTFAACLDREMDSWRDRWMVFTEPDLERIQQAYESSSLSTSLFSHLAESATCNAQHQAKLDLSSVREGQMKILLRKCQETTSEKWLPAGFTHSLKEPKSGISAFNSICSSTENNEPLRVFFNSNTMWSLNEDNGPTSSAIPPTVPCAEKSLKDCLNQNALREFLPKHRSLAGIFLATAFFHLTGSPWLREPLEAQSSLLSVPHSQPLDQWRIHVPCSLVRDAGIGDLAESIAALGVLFIELEEGFNAFWSRTDKVPRTGKKSHRLHLHHLIDSWKGIPDDIRQIACSCRDFKRHVEALTVQDIPGDMRQTAIMYQRILKPIFLRNRQLLEEFKEVFAANFAPRGTLPPFRRTIKPDVSDLTLKLFDTQDLSPSMSKEKLEHCDNFFNDAKAFFRYIEGIRSSPYRSTKRKKIRIVLLDSGIDAQEWVMEEAIDEGLIDPAECESFVDSPWNKADDMHGTNVAELATRAAPAADIVIGKVCEYRDKLEDLLPRLAKAITWATHEKKADIICLALGYRGVNDAVDTAVDDAIREGILVVAAASNDGARFGRARPASLDGVICMHASDGVGNRGDMNPPWLDEEKNFLTLGDGVGVQWKGRTLPKAGTSFATPIAAGFIACMLEFVADKVTDLTPVQARKLRRKKGMEAILQMMSKEVYGAGKHYYIHPQHMCNWENHDEVDKIADRIRNVLQKV